MQMRWDILVAQLSQPVMSKEGAASYQGFLSSLWDATEAPEDRETKIEQSKQLLEQATGIPFVRK